MLENLFLPEKVAVVGASREEGKTGHEIFDNLLHDFEGEVIPVNPKAEEIHGVECEDEIPEEADMAVIAVPAEIVPDVIDDCGDKNVDAAIIVSAGFSESGNEGLEEELVEKAEDYGVDLLGPNVLGLINTGNMMNASFASKMPEEGDISFMSQSGAFCTAILDYAKAEHIGFRHFVSLGNKSMLDEVDFLRKWRNDDTGTILSYTEGIENGRKFLEEAEKTSQQKPVVMVKSGRTDQGGEAASSHTGSIAGSYEAYRAAFRKAGVIEAESNRELLDFGRAFDYQPLPEGERIAVVTNAGGPGVIAADEVAEQGLELSEFSDSTREELESFLPDEASPENPLDVIGDAGHERYKKALETVAEDDGVDALLVLLTPQANTEIEKTAKTISKVSEASSLPVFACLMGEEEVQPGIEILEQNQVPEFQDPMDAVNTLEAMKGYREFLEREKTFKDFDYSRGEAAEALESLENFEDREDLFTSYGFNVALTEVAEAPKDASRAAMNIGYPLVMKIDSPDIRHKTEVGAVETGIETKEEVKEAFHGIVDSVHREAPGSEIKGVQLQEQLEGLEIALGVKRDPQFGPMVMIGLGGIYIEVLNDVSFGIAPISEEEAELMIDELKSHEVFEGARGKNHDLEPVRESIIRLGDLALEHDEISEIDLNPAILRDGKLFLTDIAVEVESG